MVKRKKLQFDITTHFLVPKHIKLNKKDTKQLLSEMNITFQQLPKIFITDPAIENMDLEVGDIIKIERPSKTAKTAIYYRGVVNE